MRSCTVHTRSEQVQRCSTALVFTNVSATSASVVEMIMSYWRE